MQENNSSRHNSVTAAEKPHHIASPDQSRKQATFLSRVPVHCITPFCSDALVSPPNLYPPYLARRRQRRQQETEEQGIRGIMIVLHCRKPRFLSLPASPLIYRSKSAKFQLYITARRIIIFRRTAPGHICSFFFSFSKSGRRNNAKSAFQYTVNNNAT